MRGILIMFISGMLTTALCAEVSFDKGISQEELKNENNILPVPDVKYILSHTRYTKDCVVFTLGASDQKLAGTLSDRVKLRNDEYRTECETYYGPDGQQIMQHCYERYVRSYYGSAQVWIKKRNLLPWEKETFKVCIEGQGVINFYPVHAVYEYEVQKLDNGAGDVSFSLYPRKKIEIGVNSQK